MSIVPFTSLSLLFHSFPFHKSFHWEQAVELLVDELGYHLEILGAVAELAWAGNDERPRLRKLYRPLRFDDVAGEVARSHDLYPLQYSYTRGADSEAWP